jgi:hypothetical protein
MTVATMAGAGVVLSADEISTLQAIWLHAEKVDWTTYDRLRERVLAWRPNEEGGRTDVPTVPPET